MATWFAKEKLSLEKHTIHEYEKGITIEFGEEKGYKDKDLYSGLKLIFFVGSMLLDSVLWKYDLVIYLH